MSFYEFLAELDKKASSSASFNEEDDFGQFFESQQEERNNANVWRITINADVWNDVGDV